MIVTFSGVDGAGKTTILKDFKQILESKYGVTVVELRHRPSYLPILSSFIYGKSKAERIAAQSPPHRGTNMSKVSSLLRFSYYFFDYLVGGFIMSIKYANSDSIILYDRYYFDFIADTRRFNIMLSSRLILKFYNLVQKPDLNIFLYASVDTILERKNEMSRVDILSATRNYRELFEYLDAARKEKYMCIENIDKETTLKLLESEFFTIINDKENF